MIHMLNCCCWTDECILPSMNVFTKENLGLNKPICFASVCLHHKEKVHNSNILSCTRMLFVLLNYISLGLRQFSLYILNKITWKLRKQLCTIGSRQAIKQSGDELNISGAGL